jgi:hypothetical protein
MACPAAGGLAAQPVPRRPGRGRTRLRPGRAARQRECRRGRAGHELAVAAQGVHPPRAGHASPQTPRRSGSAPLRRPAGALASLARRLWTRCSSRSTKASSRLRVAPMASRERGCAGPRRSRRSATAPWSSSTPKAGWHPSGGWSPSPAAPNAPNSWPTTGPPAPTAASTSVPPAPTAANAPAGRSRREGVAADADILPRGRINYRG